MECTRLARQGNADILRRTEVAAVRRDQCRLDRLKEEFLVNPLFVRQLLQRLQKLLAVILLLGIFSCQPQSLLKIDMQAHL